ncbi:hypothetical protein Tco_0705389 [Tanacetum coccineum]|uniref:Uncharacterized protein n=1 Tax=Tanacetum coccineum TaxID=301880 RepID=A0ABQ4Y5Z2_9ASTR
MMKKSHNLDSQANYASLENRVYRLERQVVEMSKFNIQATIDKFVEARLKQIELPKGIPDVKKIKLEKAAKQNVPNHSAHQALYDALVVSLSIDEDDMDRIFGKSHQTKRKMDDHDKDPSPNADKDSKKRQEKPDSYKDDKDQARSSKQGKSSTKPSKSNKPIDADKVIHDVETYTRECVEDLVHDYIPTAPDGNKTKWFKQSPRPATPESPDPDWSKDHNADIEPSQNWFLELEKTGKPPKDFNDVPGCPVFELFKGSCRSCKELEYHLEQRYLAFSDKLDCTNPEGDIITQDFSKPLPLLSAHGRQYIPILSIFRITVEKYCGYGYLKEMVVKRENQKEYMFKESEFPSLHLNDIVDITIIKHKVEELTKPQVSTPGVDRTYKFGDATITKVRDELKYRLTNSRFSYNINKPTRPWSDKDKKQAMAMVKEIEKTLHRRRISKSLECYVGGRNHEADYRLLTRTD